MLTILLLLALGPVSVRVSPAVQIYNYKNSIYVEVVVPRNPDNRLLTIEFYNSFSEIELHGDNSLPIFRRVAHNIEPGEYEVIATLYRVVNGKTQVFTAKARFIVGGA